MRLVFMGTPDFAAVSLRALYEAGHEILAVFTRADTPKNRGLKLLPPPVKVLAMAYGIPVFQPKNLRGEETLAQLRALAPQVIVVAAYGRILPQAVLDVPDDGCLNVHASLLPKYRGAAPIHAAILNGETRTGVTIMKMEAGLDTGDMLLPAAVDILPDEPFGSLHDRLAALGGETIVRALRLLEEGRLAPVPQREEEASYTPMIAPEDCRVDFAQRAGQVACRIRAFDPQPGAFALLAGEKIKLFAASALSEKAAAPAGSILRVERAGAVIACGEGAVRVGQVRAAGGKRMPADAFFRGRQALLKEIFA